MACVALLGLGLWGCLTREGSFRPIAGPYGYRATPPGIMVGPSCALYYRDTRGREHQVFNSIVHYELQVEGDVCVFVGNRLDAGGGWLVSRLFATRGGRPAVEISDRIIADKLEQQPDLKALGTEYGIPLFTRISDGVKATFTPHVFHKGIDEVSVLITWAEIEQLLAEAEANGGKLPPAK